MANTTSLSFPNMFRVSQNKVGVLEDSRAVSNRCRLLLLTEPTELFNDPDFGVGLKQYLFQYNDENTKKIVENKISDKINQYEPCVDASSITFSDELISEDTDPYVQEYNKMKFTVGLVTTFRDEVSLNFEN